MFISTLEKQSFKVYILPNLKHLQSVIHDAALEIQLPRLNSKLELNRVKRFISTAHSSDILRANPVGYVLSSLLINSPQDETNCFALQLHNLKLSFYYFFKSSNLKYIIFIKRPKLIIMTCYFYNYFSLYERHMTSNTLIQSKYSESCILPSSYWILQPGVNSGSASNLTSVV